MFAGCLLADKEGEGAQELRQLASPKLHVVQLDVTKQEDWDKTRDYIKSHARSSYRPRTRCPVTSPGSLTSLARLPFGVRACPRAKRPAGKRTSSPSAA